MIARNLNVLGIVLFLHRYNLTTVLMLGTRLYRRQRLRDGDEWVRQMGETRMLSINHQPSPWPKIFKKYTF